MPKNELDYKLYSITHRPAVNTIEFKYWSDISFLEKLGFLLGKNKIYIDNSIEHFGDGKILINNHIKLLNLGA